MSDGSGYSNPGIAGSGAIASGLAAVATTVGEVTLLARSDESAEKAAARVEKAASKLDGADASRLRTTTDPADLAGCDIVVESVVEDLATKGELLAKVAAAAPQADLATTTSSLGVADIGERAGVGAVTGLHVFNPVPRMELIEVCFPEGVGDETRERVLAWCSALGKTAVEVPDLAGFVVNRLLFPFLFDAVRLLEETGMEPEQVDTCMKLGAGHPMGPLALLDFVGMDVAKAIGDALYADSSQAHHKPPERIDRMVAAGELGRKAGQGFYSY